MKAELVPDNGDPPIPIRRDITVIGRKNFCDVVIDHHSLSKRHCVVVKTDGLLVIRDLATTNGTKVKGQKIRWAALLPDDRITLGGYKMRVYLGPDDAPGPSERAGVGRASAPAAGFPREREPEPLPIPRGVGVATGQDAPSFTAPSTSSGVQVLEDDSDDDSGWRKLISSNAERGGDLIIELE
jgi:predicted component of type VI protein secretion system